MILSLLIACAAPPDSAAPVVPDTDTTPVDETADLDPPELGVQLTIGPVEVPPGEERYLCKTTRLPNVDPLDIVALEHQASPSMHHFNIWGLLAGPEEAEGTCDELWGQTSMQLASPLYASQDPYFHGEFPEGVAAQLPAAQLVLMEYHVINPTTDTLYAEAKFNAYAAEPGTVEAYANGIYGSIDDLSLPPHEDSVFAEKCFVDHDLDVFAIGSHFHSRGVLFEVFEMDAAGVAGDLVYSNTDWESPTLLIRSDDPIHVASGTGFEFRCHYHNDTDGTIVEGENTTDEMCMFVGIYYPDQGFLRCRSG